jgi:hypothetical protein
VIERQRASTAALGGAPLRVLAMGMSVLDGIAEDGLRGDDGFYESALKGLFFGRQRTKFPEENVR